MLRLALATLGGRTAEMFTLRFIEGHSNGEIAEMFGVSALVVGVTLHRARKQLQKEIKQLKIRAEEFRKMALKYKRSFGKAEREQRNLLFKEVKNIRTEIIFTE